MKNKILVIEDDRAISELLCMNLEAAGYETVAAYDGEEARRLLLWHEDADMAVVDIMLPGKDGFALMEYFKKKDIPVIYLTAKDDVTSKGNVFILEEQHKEVIFHWFQINRNPVF